MECTAANMKWSADRIQAVFDRARRRVTWRWWAWPEQRKQALDSIDKAAQGMQDQRKLELFVGKLPKGFDFGDQGMETWKIVVLAILSILSFIPVAGVIFAIISIVLSIIWELQEREVQEAISGGV